MSMCDLLQITLRFESCFCTIKDTMAGMHQAFASDSEDIQREWLHFSQKVGAI